MNYPQFWTTASLRRKRIYSILFMLVIAVLATFIGFLVPMSTKDAQDTYSWLNQTVTTGTSEGTLVPQIFVNNYRLCLLMFVPLAGAGIGLSIMFMTGQSFRAVLDIQMSSGAAASSAAAANMTATTAIIALALIGLVFLLEYVSYTVAMTESIWLFRRIAQGKGMWRKELKYLLAFIGLVTVLLIVGALVETYTITAGY